MAGADCGVWTLLYLRAVVDHLVTAAPPPLLPTTLDPGTGPRAMRQHLRARVQRLAAPEPPWPRTPLILVGGASNSGKTSCVQHLPAHVGSDVHVVVVPQDDYFVVRGVRADAGAVAGECAA